jgi:hypothetical protein
MDDKQEGEGLATDTFNPNDKSTLVLLPILNQTELYIPKYFIQQVFSKKQKEGTRKFRLFVPTTSTRNLATRKAQKSIEIKRVNRDEIELLNKEGEDIISPPPKLSEFSKKDQAKLKEYFAELKNEEPLKEYELNKRPKTGKKKVKAVAEPSPQYEEPIPEPEPSPAPREQKKRGRKQKYATVEEAKEAQAEQKRQASKKLYAALTKERLKQKAIKKGKFNPNEVGTQVKPQMAEPIETQTGEGVMSDIKQGVKGAIKTVVKGVKKVSKFAEKVIDPDKWMPPSVKRVLADHGTETITSLTLRRNPVSDLITGAMNVVSGGVFNQKLKNQPYDKLFHLGIVVKTDRTSFVLEKIERVNVSYQISSPKGLEEVSVSVPAGLTVEALINNTKDRMGKTKFLDYDGYKNNCQDFIMNVLEANGLSNDENTKFVKQDTQVLFEESPILAKVSKKLTDVGASFNALFRGGAINENYEENNISPNIIMDFQYMLPQKELQHRLQLGDMSSELPEPLQAGRGIGRTFKKIGRQIDRVGDRVGNVVRKVDNTVKAVDDALDMMKNVPTAARAELKKVGLDVAEILLKKGVPATAATIAGVLGTMAGGPALGIASSVGASYLTSLAANEIAKREGVQGSSGSGLYGSGLYAQTGQGMDSDSEDECCGKCEMCGGKLFIDKKISVRDIYNAAKSVPKTVNKNIKSLKQGKPEEEMSGGRMGSSSATYTPKRFMEGGRMPPQPKVIDNGIVAPRPMGGMGLGKRPPKGSPEMKEWMAKLRGMKKK